MSTFLHRQYVIAALNTAIESWPADYKPRDVIAHAGRVTLDDLKYISSKKNALMVSCLRTSDVMRDPLLYNGVTVLARMAVFVGTCDTRRAKRDAAALVVTDLVTELVHDNTFDNEFCREPENINSDNRYSVTVDKTGANLWAVTWDQRIALVPVEEVQFNQLQTIYSELDSADEPKLEAINEDLHQL